MLRRFSSELVSNSCPRKAGWSAVSGFGLESREYLVVASRRLLALRNRKLSALTPAFDCPTKCAVFYPQMSRCQSDRIKLTDTLNLDGDFIRSHTRALSASSSIEKLVGLDLAEVPVRALETMKHLRTSV